MARINLTDEQFGIALAEYTEDTGISEVDIGRGPLIHDAAIYLRAQLTVAREYYLKAQERNRKSLEKEI